MKKGDLYKFKYSAEADEEPLMYVGYNWSGNGYWHQFTKPCGSKVWCELAPSDLHLIEEV